MSTEATIETDPIGGDAFAALLATREAEAPAEPAPVAKPDPVEPAVPDKPASKATPLDIAPIKPEPAPPDDDELLKIELPANASASAKSNFGKLRDALKERNTKLSELSAEVAALKGKTSSVSPEMEARLKAAEEAVKERESELERVAFESSPRFKKFINSSNDELEQAKSYLEGSEIDPGVIDMASRVTGAKRLAILAESGLDNNAIAAIAPHLARMDTLGREAKAAKEDWKTTNAQWEQEQKTAADKQSAALKDGDDRIFSTVGKKMADIEPFQKIDGNDEWNTAVEERLGLAKQVFDGAFPLEKTSEILYKGVAFDVMRDAWVDLRSKYNDMVAENARIKAASPGAGGAQPERGGGRAATGDPFRDAAATFEEQLAKRVGL